MTVDATPVFPTNSSTSALSPSSSVQNMKDDDATESERSKVVNAVIFVMSIFEISLLVTFMSTFITFYDSFAVVVMDSSRRYSLHEVDAQRDAQTNKESAEADVKLETLELVLPASI